MTPLPRLSRRFLVAYALVAMLLMVAACQKDLVRWPNYLRTSFNVNFDWSKVPDANPSVMQFVVFSEEGRTPLEFGFVKKTGGSADLDAGDYRAVCFNSDTEVLTTSGVVWKDYEITSHVTELYLFSPMFGVTRAVPRGEGSENEPVMQEPDMLWTGTTADVFVAGNNRTETVTLPMQASVYTYHFTIRNVANLQFVTEMVATISGMSASMYPASGQPSEIHCTIPVHVSSDGVSTISCAVRSFGHCPGHETSQATAVHNLLVYARLTDGSKWYYDFDVTAELHDPDNVVVHPDGTTEIDIELDQLPFPQPIANDSGVHPEVEEWNEINEDIHM